MAVYAWYVPAFGQLLSKECFRPQAGGHIRRMSYGCLRNDDLRSLGRVVEGLNGCASRAVVRNRCCRHDISGICTEKLKSVQQRCGCVNEPAPSEMVRVRVKIMWSWFLLQNKTKRSIQQSSYNHHSKYRNVGRPRPVSYAIASAARFKEINSFLKT